MATLYVIPNWEKDFENAKSRVVERATWFPVQNHFDGKRMRRLQKLKNSVELYGAFHAIVAIASKCTYRGVLLDDHGPINAMDLEDKTGFPAKIFTRAFQELSAPMIGLLEKHEIEEENGAWTLPAPVRTWAISQGHRRTLKSPNGNGGTHGDAKGRSQKADAPPKTASPPIPPSPAASPKVPEGIQKPAVIPESPKKGTEGNGREGKALPVVPHSPPALTPTLSQAGEGGEPANLISNPETAKKLICEKILLGADPSRPWGYSAMERLGNLLPIPLEEILDVGWFRSLPKVDDVPELKNRRDPVTETGLMHYWGDEVQRAREFKKKWRGSNNGVSKPEPPNWREVFFWLHGTNIYLPATFAELDRDQKEEYQRNVQAFGNRGAAERCGDPALL